jgi:hypothetical protein
MNTRAEFRLLMASALLSLSAVMEPPIFGVMAPAALGVFEARTAVNNNQM